MIFYIVNHTEETRDKDNRHIVGTAEAEAETNTVGTADIPQGAGRGRRNAVGTETPTRGGVGGGRRKWKSGEFMRYCREMRIDIWEGACGEEQGSKSCRGGAWGSPFGGTCSRISVGNLV